MRLVKPTIGAALLLGSLQAFAGTRLTAAQCNSYPFVPLRHEVTHAQLEQELAELESVGYTPHDGDDPNYPQDMQHAETRLRAKYRADCAPAHSSFPSPETSQPD